MTKPVVILPAQLYSKSILSEMMLVQLNTLTVAFWRLLRLFVQR